jgi:hypothetical protein
LHVYDHVDDHDHVDVDEKRKSADPSPRDALDPGRTRC